MAPAAVPADGGRFAVVYQLLSITHNRRIRLEITAPDTDPHIPSLVSLWPNADWHERETLLKAAFPLAVHAERSTAETQFGHVHRATHTNTSWDAARFEACQHRCQLMNGRAPGNIPDSAKGRRRQGLLNFLRAVAFGPLSYQHDTSSGDDTEKPCDP